MKTKITRIWKLAIVLGLISLLVNLSPVSGTVITGSEVGTHGGFDYSITYDKVYHEYFWWGYYTTEIQGLTFNRAIGDVVSCQSIDYAKGMVSYGIYKGTTLIDNDYREETFYPDYYKVSTCPSPNLYVVVVDMPDYIPFYTNVEEVGDLTVKMKFTLRVYWSNGWTSAYSGGSAEVTL